MPTRRHPWLRTLAACALTLTASPATRATPWPTDPRGPRGAPPVVAGPTSPSVDAVATARAYLTAHAASLGLGPDALAAARVRIVHDLGRGALVVSFEQRADGRLVLRERLGVVLTREGRPLTAMGHLHPAATPGRRWVASLSPEDAVARALADLGPLVGAAPFVVDPAVFVDTGVDEGGFTRFALAPADGDGLLLGRPARVREVWLPRGPVLVPGYEVEVRAEVPGRGEAVARSWVVGARDGAILSRFDQVRRERWRVWAQTDGDKHPLPMPTEDFLPYPGDAPDQRLPTFAAPPLVAVNARGRDPWLPPGATQTQGNNVDAYVDLYAPDGFSNGDLRALETSDGVYDRLYDVGAEPDASPDQLMAAATQVFYLTNWLHDWYYESGFDEEAGNAQVSNYGRGGAGGDPLLVEANDFSVADNANMSTPADGASPVMQLGMYSGRQTLSLALRGHDDELTLGGSDFGPRVYRVDGPIVRVLDEAGAASDACAPILDDLDGAIALVDRGTCSFESKARRVEAAGAIAVIIANNNAGEGANPLFGDGERPPAEIPAVSVSLEDGALLDGLLAGGPVHAELRGEVGVRPTSAVEGATAAHEWGHYLHLRLVDCQSAQCSAASEGWGDFVAMLMSLEANDDLRGAYAQGAYTAAPMTDDAAWFGVRRYPYSTDPAKNPLTLASLGADAVLPSDVPALFVFADAYAPHEVHNAGEVWAEMMFEAFAALVAEAPRLTFEQARRRMGDYVVGSMILSPPNPTYLEQRDALLAVALASDPLDADALAAAFAKRGAGSCAVGPGRDDQALLGTIEGYELKPRVVLASALLSDARASCDGADGTLDAGEGGVVRVVVRNPSYVALTDAQVAVASTTEALGFPSGREVAVPTVPPFGEVAIEVPVALDAALEDPLQVDLEVTVTAPAACEGGASIATGPWANANPAPATSAVETVEAPDALTVWQAAPEVWSRGEPSPGVHAFLGADAPTLTDTALVSPPLVVADDRPLVLRFAHAHDFEAGTFDTADGPVPTWYDGGVIELSTDDGATWEDVSLWAEVPYGATLFIGAGNPLAGRPAFGGRSASWPALASVTLDLGEALAGETIRLRFRIGTDEAAGGPGWILDDIAIEGIVGAPFTSLVASSAPTTYLDLDGDGVGDRAAAACPLPEHAVPTGGDCDDRAVEVHPGAPELCDGRDNDCDGEIDQGLAGLRAFYVDGDGDGYGAGGALVACAAPPESVERAGDCNDARADIHPGAPERAGGTLDRDCDGIVPAKADDGCAGGGHESLALAGLALMAIHLRGRRHGHGPTRGEPDTRHG